MRPVLAIVSDNGDLVKRCNGCQQKKPVAAFSKHSKAASGLNYKCKACDSSRMSAMHKKKRSNGYKTRPRDLERYRDKNFRKNYGIGLEEVRSMHRAQNGMCANRTCGRKVTLDGDRDQYKAFVDHDHNTGKVRGILCIGCNTTLGFLEQTNKILGLTEYLHRHSELTERC